MTARPPPGGRQTATSLAVGVVFFALCAHLFVLTALYTVNVLFWDQWGLYQAYLPDVSWWETFHWQHGPHRQGLGGILTRLVAELSGWNVRAEAFVVVGVVCLAAAAALWLSSRLFEGLSGTDLAIPLLVLTPSQYAIFADTPNVAHGALPLLLLVLLALAWTLERPGPRYAAVLVLHVLLVYTGFGVVAGPLTPTLLLLDALRAWRAGGPRAARLPLACLVLALLAFGSFFAGYGTESPTFHTRSTTPVLDAPRYAALAFADVCGVEGTGLLPTAVGAAVLLATLAVGWLHGRRLLDLDAAPPGPSLAIAVLLGFGMLYAANLGYGRSGFPPETAQSSRYVPLLLPSFLGMILHVRTLRPGGVRQAAAVATVAIAAFASIPMRSSDAADMRILATAKSRWVRVYLRSGRVSRANRVSGTQLHPFPERVRLEEQLDFMRERRLGFFRGVDAPPRGP